MPELGLNVLRMCWLSNMFCKKVNSNNELQLMNLWKYRVVLKSRGQQCESIRPM